MRRILALAVSLFVVAPSAAQAVEPVNDVVTSFDGHQVPITVYRAVGSGERAPTLIWSHGWSGSRAPSRTSAIVEGTSGPAYGEFFSDHGYNVVLVDQRGHGEARQTSTASFPPVSPSVEGRDMRYLISWIARQKWASLDAPGDPVVGTMGVSMGAIYQIVTAAVDNRVDAISPAWTPQDIQRSLAPNGVLRSAWIDFLYGTGTLEANVDPFLHELYAWATLFNDVPDGLLPGEPDMTGVARQSSASGHVATLDTPTLVIQGMPDTLFNFNEGWALRQQMMAAGVETRITTHLTGHVLPLLQPIELYLNSDEETYPCEHAFEATLLWMDKHLKGLDVDTGPAISIALDEGGCIDSRRAPDLMVAKHRSRLTSNAFVRVVQGVPNPLVRQVKLWTNDTDHDVVIAGIPHLRTGINTHMAPGGAIVLFALAIRDAGPVGKTRVLNSQLSPWRRPQGASGTVEVSMEMAGIGAVLQPGETLVLQVQNVDDQFITAYERAPGIVWLRSIAVDVPMFACDILRDTCKPFTPRQPKAGLFSFLRRTRLFNLFW